MTYFIKEQFMIVEKGLWLIEKNQITFDLHKLFLIYRNAAVYKEVCPNCIVTLIFITILVERSLRWWRLFLKIQLIETCLRNQLPQASLEYLNLNIKFVAKIYLSDRYDDERMTEASF